MTLQILNIVSDVKNMWRSLQTSYKRKKKESLPVSLPSGSGATTKRMIKPWPYMDMMRFLDPILVKRRTIEHFEGNRLIYHLSIYIFINLFADFENEDLICNIYTCNNNTISIATDTIVQIDDTDTLDLESEINVYNSVASLASHAINDIDNNVDNISNNIDNSVHNIDNNVDNSVHNIDNNVDNISNNSVHNIDNSVNNIDNQVHNIEVSSCFTSIEDVRMCEDVSPKKRLLNNFILILFN